MGVSWNSLQPGGAGLPAMAVPGASAPQNLSEAIQGLMKPISDKDITAAVTPITGAHAASLPSSMTTPVAPFQPTPQDNRRVRGAGNARAQGIGNAIVGVTNALGKFATATAQVKQGQIRDAATKVITAQQAMDEAQQQLDMAKQDGRTEDALKFQQQVEEQKRARDAVFADPKMGKALQKGFNFSYTDPSANKTDEHAAVQAALKDAKTAAERKAAIQKFQQEQNAKRGAAMGEAYAKSQPQGLAPNTAAQARVQYALDNQKIAQGVMKDYMTMRASMYRSDKMYSAEQMRAMASTMQQEARFRQQEMMQNRAFQHADQTLGKRFAHDFSMVIARGNEARLVANQIYTDKEFDPLTMRTKSEAASTKYANNYVADMSDIQKLISARDKQFPKGADSSWYKNGVFVGHGDGNADAYENFNTQIRLLENQKNLDKQAADHYQNMAKTIDQQFNLNGVSNADITDASGDSADQSDAIGSEGDFSNPFNWLSDDESSSSEE